MKEYIEREALMNHIKANGNPDNLPDGYVATPNDVYVFAIAAVETFPAADVVERKRGEWIHVGHYPPYCSECEGLPPKDCEGKEFYDSDFCPNCGADMRSPQNILCDQTEEGEHETD